MPNVSSGLNKRPQLENIVISRMSDATPERSWTAHPTDDSPFRARYQYLRNLRLKWTGQAHAPSPDLPIPNEPTEQPGIYGAVTRIGRLRVGPPPCVATGEKGTDDRLFVLYAKASAS
jgi:hypothetical protein